MDDKVIPLRHQRPRLEPLIGVVAALHWHTGRDTYDIAQMLGVSEAAVYNTLHEISCSERRREKGW